MQCVPGSCLGDTQCQQRALRPQSVRFLYLSVSSLLLSEHTKSLCAGLLVLSWNPKHPSWVAVDLGDCPCCDIELSAGTRNALSFCSFIKTQLFLSIQDGITIMQRYNTQLKEIPSKHTHKSVTQSWPAVEKVWIYLEAKRRWRSRTPCFSCSLLSVSQVTHSVDALVPQTPPYMFSTTYTMGHSNQNSHCKKIQRKLFPGHSLVNGTLLHKWIAKNITEITVQMPSMQLSPYLSDLNFILLTNPSIFIPYISKSCSNPGTG